MIHNCTMPFTSAASVTGVEIGRRAPIEDGVEIG
jgi:hypothetical protein